MAYQYKGTIRDIEDDTPAPRPKKLTEFDPSACGEYRGYRRHQQHGVPACDPCLGAMAAYSRDRYQKRPAKAFNPDACGSWKGWQRHQYHNVPACDACMAASREYQRERRAANAEYSRARRAALRAAKKVAA
jgi:hypothetical protein